jgi:hypothetical protein
VSGPSAALPRITVPLPTVSDDDGSALLPAAAALLLLVLASGSFVLLVSRTGRLGDP